MLGVCRILIWFNIKSGCLVLLILSVLFCLDPLAHADKTNYPNVVILLVDDLGLIATPQYGASSIGYKNESASSYTDGSGNSKTPNLDAFAKEALLFSHCYASPSCAPSRATLVSGQYPFSTGITYPGWAPQSNPLPANLTDANYLGKAKKDQVTNAFANIMDSSYSTAFGGKWNLKWGFTSGLIDWGTDQSALWDPYHGAQVKHLNDCGFDYTYSFMGNTIDYYPDFFPANPFNSTPPSAGSYFPNKLNAFAADFVSACINNAKPPNGYNGTLAQPFLLHYCFGSVHDFPSDPSQQQRPPGSSPSATHAEVFVDRVVDADSKINNVLSVIDADSGLKNNTIVIVAGDNGLEMNSSYYNSTNTPKFLGAGAKKVKVEGAKLTFHSWGSRVPLMIRWPAKIKSDTQGTWNDTLVDFSDLYATIVEAGGGANTAGYTPNGVSFLKYLGKKESEWSDFGRQAVYCQMKDQAIVVSKNYSLWVQGGGDFSLYNINNNNPESYPNYPFDDGTKLPTPPNGWGQAIKVPTSNKDKGFKVLYDYYTNELNSPLGSLNLN